MVNTATSPSYLTCEVCHPTYQTEKMYFIGPYFSTAPIFDILTILVAFSNETVCFKFDIDNE